MFEAVILMCLEGVSAPCREVLLPGYEARDLAACEARLPENATCRPVGEVLAFDQVAPGVFVHVGLIEEPDESNRGDVSNVGFVIGADSVAVIDSGTALWMGEAIWRSVRAQTDLPVSHVILTHMHPDHVLGARAFPDSEIVGHAGLARALADRRGNYLESLERLIGAAAFIGTDVPEVTVRVESSFTVDLGGRVLELQAWPTSHTGTDLTVFDAQTSTLFAGDLVFHQHTPALDGRLRGWQATLSEMALMGVERVVPGHGGPVLEWPEGGAAMQRYLDVLAEDTLAAIERGERLGDAISHIAGSEAPHWELFEAYNPRNATVAFTELEWE